MVKAQTIELKLRLDSDLSYTKESDSNNFYEGRDRNCLKARWETKTKALQHEPTCTFMILYANSVGPHCSAKMCQVKAHNSLERRTTYKVLQTQNLPSYKSVSNDLGIGRFAWVFATLGPCMSLCRAGCTIPHTTLTTPPLTASHKGAPDARTILMIPLIIFIMILPSSPALAPI